MPETIIRSSIVAVIDHGTIVQVVLADDTPIYFDHTPFRWLFEEQGGNLIGRTVEYDGETVRFEEEAP